MARSTSIESALAKYSHLSRDRIDLADGNLSIPSMKSAVLFVLATWSGPAMFGLRELTSVLVNDPNAPRQLVVIDADEVGDRLVESLGARPQGNGETFWVKDGRIVASILVWKAQQSQDEVRRNNAMLIAKSFP